MSAVAKKDFLEKEEQNPLALPWLEDVANLSDAPDWVQAMRSTGADAFAVTGIPTPKHEDWKYTNLRKMKAQDFSYSNDVQEISKDDLPEVINPNAKRIVLVDGVYQELLSDVIDNASITSLLDSKLKDREQYLVTVGDLKDEPMKALNAAYMQDGVVLKVEDNVEVGQPVEILHYNTGNAKAIYPRSLYWFGKNSKATIFERFVGVGEYMFNSYASLVLEDGCNLKFYRTQAESETAYHFTSTVLQMHRDANIECFNLNEGGAIARTEVRSDLVSSGSYNGIGGLYLMRNDQSNDFKILTQHLEPHCNSHQLFRGVVDDKANAVFQGKIYVARDAQKTDADQMNKAIIISDDAKANFKPELEIYADDVRCTHGATTGHIEDNALFYMMSRGVDRVSAEKLLVKAFLSDALEQISCDVFKEYCDNRIEKWLNK